MSKPAEDFSLEPLKADFRKFLWVVWRFLLLPEPTPVQYDIARWLQHGPRRSITEAFRGVGKSWVTSAFVVWCLYRNPQLNVLVLSATKQRADDFSTFTRRLIREMPELAHLRPGKDQRDANIAFDVGPARASHAPSVKSLGIGSQIAGSRADLIIPDDIEVPNNVLTQQRREKLAEQVKEFDAVLKPGGMIRYLGTPQTEESVYNTLETRGYECRIWTAEYPLPHEVEGTFKGRLAPKLAGELLANPALAGRPTDAARFSELDLLERKTSYGRTSYRLQFMLDTSLSDALKYPLKCADFIVMAVDKEMAPEKLVWASGQQQLIEELPWVGFTGDRYYRPMWVSPTFQEYTRSWMAIDPAGRGGDKVGVCVIKYLNGYLFVRRWFGLSGGYEDANLNFLATVAREEKVNAIVLETNFGDGMFSQLLQQKLRDVYPCAIEDVRQSVQKELRIIRDVEPALNQHRIVLDQSIVTSDAEVEPQQHQALYQLTRLTKDRGSLRYDDLIDVFAIAVKYGTDMMAVSTEEQIRNKRDALFDEELRRFMENAVGGSRTRDWHKRMIGR